MPGVLIKTDESRTDFITRPVIPNAASNNNNRAPALQSITLRRSECILKDATYVNSRPVLFSRSGGLVGSEARRPRHLQGVQVSSSGGVGGEEEGGWGWRGGGGGSDVGQIIQNGCLTADLREWQGQVSGGTGADAGGSNSYCNLHSVLT